MTNLEIALLITGQGMLGIFAVMGLITVLVTLFTKFGKKKNPKHKQAAAASCSARRFVYRPRSISRPQARKNS